MIQSEKMSRKDFLKKTAVGMAGLTLLGTFGIGTLSQKMMENGENSKSADKASGSYVGATAPRSTSLTWVDTSEGGVMKYWDGKEWTPIKSTWA